MNDIILIKYDLKKDVEEGDSYEIIYDHNKCFNIITALGITQKEHKKNEKFMKKLHNKNVLMVFVGYSRVDGLKIFTIDKKVNKRNIKINDILNGE